jgi:AcrR family transcriptional regulator
MAVIAEEGLVAARTRAVTERSGVGVGLLNHYFRWSELRADAWSRIVTAAIDDAVDTSLAPAAAMQRFFAHSFDAGAQRLWRLWIEAFDLAATDEPLARALESADARLLRRLAEMLEAGSREGAWALSDANGAALRLIALQDGLAMRVMGGSGASARLSERAAERHLRIAFAMECAGS